MDIKISPGARRPIYQQIIDQIRSQVACGKLVVGAGVPSVRQLAQDLVVNHNTVAKAYAELVRDGVLESQQGRGVFVAPRRQVFSASERRRRLDVALDTFVAEAITLDYSPEQIESEVAKRLEKMASRKSQQMGDS